MTKKVQAVNEIAKNGTNNCKQKQNFGTQFENAEHLEQMGEKSYTDSYYFVNSFCNGVNSLLSSFYSNFISCALGELEEDEKTNTLFKSFLEIGGVQITSDLKSFLSFAKANTKNFTCKLVRLDSSESEGESEGEKATKEELTAKGDTFTLRERTYKQILCNDITKILLSAKGVYKYSKSGAEQNAKNIIKQNKVSLAELLAVLTPEQKAQLGM